MITPERWAELEPLLDAALEHPTGERAAYVARATEGRPDLRRDLEVLLQDADHPTRLLDSTAGLAFAALLGDDTELVGRIFADSMAGRYTIERRIGAGGMATVYLAHDPRHDREVAVKVLHPGLAATLSSERFLAEIRTTARLQHPHLLPLLDSGEAAGQLFYVMPYVKGESLRARLSQEGILPIEEAVRIACEIAAALDYAHRNGIVHRDIKPENVLLHEGQALVADWGIALATSAAGDREKALAEIPLGTPQYMSPEQAEGNRRVDARSDIHALGCVLYEMLTGEPPFHGSTASEILEQVRTARPAPPTSVRDTVPPGIEAAVLKALAKLPADRFTTAARFAEALGGAAGRPHRTRRTDRAPRPLVMALGAVSLTLALALGVVLTRPEPAPVVARWRLALPPGQGIVTADSPRFALSPDGALLAYVGPGPAAGTRQLWIKRRDQLASVVVAGTEDAEQPVFSPDGTRLAFYVRGQSSAVVRVVPVDGGPAITVATSDQIAPSSLATAGFRGIGLAWGDDGYLYMDGQDGWGVRRVRATGGEVEHAAVRDTTNGLYWWPDPLPGGRDILVTLGRWASPVSGFQVAVTNPATGVTRVLVPGVYGRYATSGHLLYVTAEGVLMAAPFDPKRAVTTGPAVMVVDGLDITPFGGVGLSMTREGTLAYLSGLGGSGNTPVWVTREGVETPVDPTDPRWRASFGYGVAISPDGTRLVYATYGPRVEREVWVRHLPAGPLEHLTMGSGGSRPAWGDDQTVLFTSRRDGQLDLWAQRADGSTPARPLVQLGRTIQEFSTVPATPWMALRVQNRDGLSDIWAIRPGVDTAAVPLIVTPHEERVPTLSPNGRFLAYVSNESGRQEVYVRPFPDVQRGRWQVSTAGGNAPLWSRDGTELFFMGAGHLHTAAVRTQGTFQLLGQQRLFSVANYEGSVSQGYDQMPDGRFMMFRRGSGPVNELVVVENFATEFGGPRVARR